MRKTSMEDGFLCSSVSDWQKQRILEIDTNTLKFPDMGWNIEGSILYDIRSMYSSSVFFNLLFESEKKMTKNVSYDENNLPIFTMDAKMTVFQTLRVFCHTGLVRFYRGESIVKTIERYSGFHMYGIDGGKYPLRTLISDKITPVNAIQAFEFAIGREDSELLCIINEYIINYAFLVFRHRNFQTIKRESLHDLILLMSNDSLNIKELDLLEAMYTLCKKKVTEKDFSDEFHTPIQIMKFNFGGINMWDCVNLENISMKEFMGFIHKHDTFMENEDIVSTLKTMYTNELSGSSRKRKLFRLISSFPRNLNIQGTFDGPRGDVTHWDRDKIQIFYVFDFNDKKEIHLPATVFNDWTVRCKMNHVEKNITVSGSITRGSLNLSHSADEDVSITLKFVNFKHDRWKKSVITKKLQARCEFDIPNILSYNSIEGINGTGGYLFDINSYPEYNIGSWLMMSLCIETIH